MANTDRLMSLGVPANLAQELVTKFVSTNEDSAAVRTSSDTSGTSVEPWTFTSTMTGAGGTGGRGKFQLNANGSLGGWANALKAITVFSTAGKVSGLGSALVAELQLSTFTTAGTYAPLESELVVGASASLGTATSFLYCNVTGTDLSTFNSSGYLFELGAGITNTNTGLFDANAKSSINMTHALKVRIGGTT